MILCVAPSPAWDVTYAVERFREHATNRVDTVSARAGGKAVNVARVLHALGEQVTVVAPVGGSTGALFTADLTDCGIAVDVVDSAGDLRRTVTIVSDETGDATILNEGSTMNDWPAFLARAGELMAGASVVVAAGSLPSGAPVDAYAQLVRCARSHGVPVAVDTSGPALAAALIESPDLVKPNLAELPDVSDDTDHHEAARRLSESSGAAVAVTLGAEGMVLAVDGELWHGSCDRVLRGNPTGAGDAALAAFARGIRAGVAWPDVLHDAVALSGAAVLAPYAGEFDAAHHRELAEQVVVERVGARA
jgi:1-phosphofructokinase family hexose kinase